MAPNTQGLELIGLYQKMYTEQTGKSLQVNKFALRAHANALVEEFGLDTCVRTAEHYIKTAYAPQNIAGFMYRFAETHDEMNRIDRDRLDRAVQRKKLYDAMRAEGNVSE